MKSPTTLILIAALAAAVTLAWHGSIGGDAAAGIISAVIAAVTTGHYVKTTLNGTTQLPPLSTTTIHTPAREETIATAPAGEKEGL